MQIRYILLIIACLLSQIDVTAQEENAKDTLLSGLQLADVEVLAQRRSGSSTTSYTMGRMALDHHQMLNIKDISSLLPGGKTVNSTLTDDSRFSLRSASGERGNASFGTAIEIDGIRLDNNGMMNETLGASTRSISSSNVESIEIITGIPSVEYGDISNGVVKVNTRHGSSPFIFEASTNPYTWQISVNKGFRLLRHSKTGLQHLGTLNASFEHANSNTSTASPHTSYQRNALSLAYSRTLMRGEHTFNIKAGLTGNVGGYNSEADPDAFIGTYSKVRDNQLRGNLDFSWVYDAWKIGKLKVDAHGAFTTADKRQEDYVNRSSSSAQPMIHTMQTGYFIAKEYTSEMLGIDERELGIILGPTGYWYERSFNDQKPLTWQGKLKANLSSVLRNATDYSNARPFAEEWNNNVLLGLEYNTSRNNGRGTYYEDLQYAPTWRPYRYDALPTLKNLALFLEDRLTLGRVQLTAGLRDDITMINGSDYGTISSLSPRVNAKYDILGGGIGTNGKAKPTLSVHVGYGKSVKLPSFQILYPQDSYLDKLVFTPGSTADNKAFYAYNTYVSTALRNRDLQWQHTNQLDLGAEATWRGARLSVSFYYQKTLNPYQQVNVYTPVSYRYTSQKALEGIGIPSAERIYSISQQTGEVSVTSATNGSSILLPSAVHRTFNYNRQFVNGSPVTRYGLEWILDLPQVKFSSNPKLGGVTLRLDGNYYHYKSIDHTMIAGAPNGISDTEGGNPLIGYYLGSNVSSASSASLPSVSNGLLSKQCNLNATATVHIPKVRLIITARLEATFLNYKRNLSEGNGAARGIILDAAGENFGKPYDSNVLDKYVALYPETYSTWDNPSEQRNFVEDLMAAKENNQQLYQQLSQLIVRSNTSYFMNPQRLSAFYSANISVTKEIGKWLSISFYANNFLNTMHHVNNSQTGLEQTLFNSGYIPKFYYGLSVRLKL